MELTDTFEMDRRSIIAALIGASALPASALAAPGKKASPGKRPAPARFLSPAQFATLSAIADTIIPQTDTLGAVGVGVPKIIDGLLRNWASAETKAKLVGVIADVDKITMASDKKSLTALTPARRKEVLLAYDKEALKLGPKPEKPQNALLAMLMGPPVMNPGWRQLKSLVINTYYNSEEACTKELVYEHVPGKWVPSLKATPATRPFASTGPF